MGYTFREVKCYKCRHIFMWKKEYETIFVEMYRWKENGECLGYAECPKCSTAMLVASHILEGIPKDSDNVIIR